MPINASPCPPTGMSRLLSWRLKSLGKGGDTRYIHRTRAKTVRFFFLGVMKESGKDSAENAGVDSAGFYDARGNAALTREERRLGADEFPPHLRAPYQYVESLVSAAYREGSRTMLDMCCGTGGHGVAAAKIGFRVDGFDISPRSVAAARQLAGQFGVAATCSFEVCGFEERISRPVHKYDVIFISGSLYYLDQAKALDFIRANLSERGMFVCVETFGGNPLMSILRHLKNRFFRHRDSVTLRGLLRQKDISRLVAGFGDSEVRFFDLLTLACGFVPPESPMGARVVACARRIDRIILNHLGARILGFKFTVVGRNPVPATATASLTGK